MSKNAPIAFIDSGVGGLPYLKWVREKLHNETFYYLADTGNFPYGEKTPDEIVSIVLNAVKYLEDKGKPKLLVIACNTASVTALDAVRAAVQIPVVGVVPAVKPAAERSRNKRIGVLATERTVKGAYLEDLVNNFASSCFVKKIAGSGIVRFIENDYFSSDQSRKNEILEAAIKQFKKSEVDTVVLGCTHFIFIEELLTNSLGPEIEVIDSREGVGNQIISILRKKCLLS
ncbi:MAG: glutamate racemase, partial [Deltaproteobacteria bacterium]|nr:glutamate racemase [Deltaproteobacteria bacterium]